MCVSAEASFGLSGVLLLTGSYCVTRAAHSDRRLMPLAVVPLIFGIQQFCEGWVWVGINQSSPRLLRASALVYLFFALFFWPFWAPFSALSMEVRRNVRAMLWVFTLLGVVLGGFLFLPLLIESRWLAIELIEHSIHYDIDASPVQGAVPAMAWQLVYLAAVAVPLFVSPVRRVFHLGLAVVLSAAVSHVFFPYAAASIWCFFAAALSLYLGGLFFRMPSRIPTAAPT